VRGKTHLQIQDASGNAGGNQEEESEMNTKAPPKHVRRQIAEMMMKGFTPGQQALIKKHGTVSQFAIACHMCVPSDISYDEAEAAIQKYRKEFNES